MTDFSRHKLRFAGLWAVLALSVIPSQAALAAPGGRELVHRKNSLYHRIYVYRRGSVVSLRFGRRTDLVQSRVDLRNPHHHMLEYTTLALCGLLYNPEPERALVLGLGGGVIPRELRHYFPECRTDVAEVDPDIPPIARKYFGFREDEKLRVHIDDGRMFIRKAARRDPPQEYDYIVLDAFTGDYIPFHLMTKEFLREVQSVLAPDGVVVANVLYTNRLADAELKTFLHVFGRCQVFMGSRSGNAMLVAPGEQVQTISRAQAVERASQLHLKHELSFDMSDVALALRPNTAPEVGAPVLTDDQAPVNWLRQSQKDPPRPVDTVELVDGTTFHGVLLEETDRQVVFRVVWQGASARMEWPRERVHALTSEGERRVLNPAETSQEE
ncbi:MAG: spermidine synthase [Planctomycetota bacterium]